MFEIPTSTTDPSYVQRTTLEGREYVLGFDWNERDGRWYLTVADADEAPLVAGVAIVTGFPLLRRKTDPRMPPGDLIAIDGSGAGLAPGFTELGARVRLCYLTAAETAAP